MNNLWAKFKAGLFTKAQFLTGVIVFLLTCSFVVFAYEAAVSLNVFSAGQKISSSQVNENFNKVNDQLAKLKQANKLTLAFNANPTFPVSYSTISFDTFYYDRLGYAYGSDLLSFNSFTVQETGIYEFTIYPYMSSGIGNGFIEIMKDGTNVSSTYFESSNYTQPSSNKLFLNSGNVIFFRSLVFQTTTLDASKTRVIIEKID